MNLSDIAPWGQPRTPLVPWQFRQLYGDHQAPSFLQRYHQGDGLLTIERLNSEIWSLLHGEGISQVVGRLAHTLGANWESIASEPVIPRGTVLAAELGDLPFRTRTHNVLKRVGLLGERSTDLLIGDTMSWQGWGVLSLFDFLAVCEAATLEVFPPNLIAPLQSAEAVGEREVEVEPRPEHERLINAVLETAGRSNRFDTVGDLLAISPGASIPGFLSELWAQAAQMPLATGDDPPPSADLLDELMDSMDARGQRLLRERTLRLDDRPTLEEMGRQLGITRERVRQLESRALASLKLTLSSSRFHPILWLIHDLTDEFGVALPLGIARDRLADRGLSEFANLLFWLAGPYKLRESWLILDNEKAPKSGHLLLMPNRYETPIPIEEAHDRLETVGIRREFANRWLNDARYLRVLDGHVVFWKGTVADKAVSVLGVAGSPMTPEEVSDRIGEGHSRSSLRNALFSDDRIVRTSKTEVGLANWGFEEYEGIVAEMDQYLERHGGQVLLDDAIDAISDQFGVSPNSVLWYANTPHFVIQDGNLRRRTEDDPFTIEGRVEETAGVYRGDSHDGAILRIAVDRDVLRGSGRAIPAPLMSTLGMHLGEARTFTAKDDQEVVVSWSDSSTSGPNIGSTRSLAGRFEAEVGDYLFIHLSQAGTLEYWVLHESDLLELDELQRAAALVGVDSEQPDTELIHAIGNRLWMRESTITRSDLRRACRRRGEIELADLIPPGPVAPEIEETLDALREVL